MSKKLFARCFYKNFAFWNIFLSKNTDISKESGVGNFKAKFSGSLTSKITWIPISDSTPLPLIPPKIVQVLIIPVSHRGTELERIERKEFFLYID